jgi:hypothetical protein
MRVTSRQLRVGLAVCFLVALTGCPTVRMPHLQDPGPAGYQRYNALQYDPYPLDDVAPPVAGARPREYDRPVPEVKRGQAYTPKRLKPPAVVSSPFATPASPILTAPPALPAPTTPVSLAAPPAAGLPYQAPSQAPVVIVPATPNVRPPY